MPGITPLVALISQNVNAALIAQELPPLVDGGIVNGRVRLDENPAAPRVVFVLKGSKYGPRQRFNKSAKPTLGSPIYPGAGVAYCTLSQYGSGYTGATTATFPAPTPAVPGAVAATGVPVINAGALVAIAMTSPGVGYAAPPTPTLFDSGGGSGAVANPAVLLPTAEQLAIWAQRSLFTDTKVFEVHAWGQATPPDSDFDFDASELLAHTVIAQAHLTAPGSVKPVSGVWTDSKPGATALMLAGHEYVFSLEITGPLLDAALLYAPVGTSAVPTTSFLPWEGGAAEAAP